MFCSNMSGLGVFYSRRIGRPPQLNDYVNSRLGDGGFADAPDDAAILGAAKITGRTKSGYTIGVLDAVANRATSRYITATGAPELRQEVEPLSNYFVGRVRKELRQGATTVGTIVTSTIRRLDDSISVNRLRSNATAVGLDWSHAWNQRVYRWRGSVVASDVQGSAPAIARVQRSSAHYFQRPDREVTSDELFGARYDTTATQLRGYGLYTRLAKESGDWLWETAQNWRSPGFEVNDLAYLDRADYRWMNFNVARQWTKPGRFYRSIFTSIGGQQQFNYDGIRNDQQAQWYGGLELPNYWNIRTFAIHRFNTEDDRLTRGGPVVRREGYDFWHAQVSTDPRQKAVFDVSFEGARTLEEGARTFYFGPGIALKPASSIFVQLSPSYYMDEEPAQYVDVVRDPTATAFGGNRYVFSFIRTRTVSLNTRVNWTLKPDLTLQLFAQPFFASGDYRDFREFAAPRVMRKLVYGRDAGTVTQDAATGKYTIDPDGAGAAAPFTLNNPDFTVRSLRGTAVMRYEYRPGSTLFFVWTQQRQGSAPYGDFSFRRDYGDLLNDPVDNVFLIKATYWIGR